jgi:hypothetical protein
VVSACLYLGTAVENASLGSILPGWGDIKCVPLQTPSPRSAAPSACRHLRQRSAARNAVDDRRRGSRGGNRAADDEISAAGSDCVAAGFLTFLAGETLLMAGNAAGLEASVPSYVGGISLWAAALVMVSAPKTFALWMRLPRGRRAVCRLGLHDPPGRALTADPLAAARRRVSVPGADLCRLDLNFGEAGPVSWSGHPQRGGFIQSAPTLSWLIAEIRSGRKLGRRTLISSPVAGAGSGNCLTGIRAGHFPVAYGQRWRCPSSGCRHLLPVNGAKDAVVSAFANPNGAEKASALRPASFSPSLYGEKCPAGQ